MAILERINQLLWGGVLLPLCVLAGIFFLVLTRAIFVSRFFTFVRYLFADGRHGAYSTGLKKGVSPLQGFMCFFSVLASPIGLAATATIIFFNGPGVIFWLWVFMPVGMALIFAEVLAGIHCRDVDPSGLYIGGPVRILRYGLGTGFPVLADVLGKAYLVLLLIVALVLGNIFQVTTLSKVVATRLDQPVLLIAFTMGFLVAAIVAGGRGRILNLLIFCILAGFVFYLPLVLYILFQEGRFAFALGKIFSSAWTIEAFAGGGVLVFIRAGLERSLFTGAGGFGLSAIANAGAITRHPARQAGIASLAVPLDVLFLITPTAMVILAADLWHKVDYKAFALLQHSFAELSVGGSYWLLCVAGLFGLAALLGWGFFGEYAVIKLFGWKTRWAFRLLWVGVVFLAPLLMSTLLLLMADTANALMALPVLVGLWFLRNPVTRLASEARHAMK